MANPHNPFAPTALADFVISDPESKMLLEAICGGQIQFPALQNAICLWGMNGTGKTTLAELLPSLLEQSGKLPKSSRPGSLFGGNFYWHLTACGSGDNSLAMMNSLKKRIDSGTSYSPSGWHYELLDEVDLLTPIAQASLKAAITQATSTIFVLTTNHIDKLDRGLVDRSLLIEMNQASPAAMEALGRRFLRKVGLTGNEIDSERLRAMAAASRGSLRSFGTAMAVAVQQLGVSLSPP